MILSKTQLLLARNFPPSQRVLVIDAGQRRIKLLLARRRLGRIRVLQHGLIDLQAEGLLSADEIRAHLQEALDAWGHPPLAVVLPQHLVTSQILDLPVVSRSQVEDLIAQEARKLSGVTETRVVYDYAQCGPAANNRQPYWVTLCQEGEIRDRIVRLGLDSEALRDFTTTASALTAAFHHACPACHRALLVHAGAQSTTTVLFQDGASLCASSLPVGGDFLTRALARIRGESEDAAEQLKRGENLLSGPAANPAFREVVDGWATELTRQLVECGGEPASLDIYLSGGAFLQPGLIDYLRRKLGLDLQPWPAPADSGTEAPAGFEVALGTAVQALGDSAQPVSLLPRDYRDGWERRLARQRVETASLVVALFCFLLLGVGTWQKTRLIDQKDRWMQKVSATQEALDAHRALNTELLRDYEDLRPLLARQQYSLGLLGTLRVLQGMRTNQGFWFVLVAEQQRYFEFAAANLSTNKEAPAALMPAESPAPEHGTSTLATTPTNLPPVKTGLIIELCVPGDSESARRTLGDLVSHLQQDQLFAKADLLPDDLRRNIALPKTVLPDRHYALSLEFAETEFQVPIKPPPAPPPGKSPALRAQQPSWRKPTDPQPF